MLRAPTASMGQTAVVKVRTASGVLNSLGELVADSLTGRIYTRN